MSKNFENEELERRSGYGPYAYDGYMGYDPYGYGGYPGYAGYDGYNGYSNGRDYINDNYGVVGDNNYGYGNDLVYGNDNLYDNRFVNNDRFANRRAGGGVYDRVRGSEGLLEDHQDGLRGQNLREQGYENEAEGEWEDEHNNQVFDVAFRVCQNGNGLKKRNRGRERGTGKRGDNNIVVDRNKDVIDNYGSVNRGLREDGVYNQGINRDYVDRGGVRRNNGIRDAEVGGNNFYDRRGSNRDRAGSFRNGGVLGAGGYW